jgi:hypothetical protein
METMKADMFYSSSPVLVKKGLAYVPDP